MSKKKIAFESILGELIAGYIEEKRAVGYKYNKGSALLKRFDALVAKQQLLEKKLPKEIVLLWTKRRPNEKDNTRNGRISIVRGFAKYMVRLGYEAYVFPGTAVAVERYSYVPYIFSKEEMKRIFTICDDYPISEVSPNKHLILPLIFRLLYGCGLRISEALNLTFSDIDLQQGTLLIRDTKFGKERIVPMAESLTECCRQYTHKVHNCDCGNQFLFPSPYGGRYKESTLYKSFREILWKAGTSHSGRGPRLHDIRHTFSVHCLKRWVLNKEDLTSLLPYLSTYLGHVDLRGTQRYLRLTADLYPEIVASVEQNFSSLVPEVLFHEAD